MKHTINAVAYVTDNGDGSNSAVVFNDLEALSRELVHYGKTLEQVQSEDDPYEDGQIVSGVKIEFEIVDGVARLTSPIRVSN